MFKKKTTPNRATYRTKKKTPRKHKANPYCLLAHGHEQAVQGVAVARPTRRHGRAVLDCAAWGLGRPRSAGKNSRCQKRQNEPIHGRRAEAFGRPLGGRPRARPACSVKSRRPWFWARAHEGVDLVRDVLRQKRQNGRVWVVNSSPPIMHV